MRHAWLLFLFINLPLIASNRAKRQLMTIDDIISGALNLVRPIFDTSKPIRNEAMLRKPELPTQDDMRDTSILGSHTRTALDDLPLCQGNSGICRFISCSAENFKKDPTFGNIQLATQVLGDAKLRKTISSNPEAVQAVCKEQGMDDSQCKLFSKGFQLIDKFITTIEKPEPKKQGMASEQETTPQPTPPPAPMLDDPQTPQDDENMKSWADYDSHAPAPVLSVSNAQGSKTWSSNPETKALQPLEIRNDLVSNWTPIPFFAPPTIPTAPPLAFKTVPSFVLPPILAPSLDNGLFFSTDKFNFMKIDNSIKRFRRSTDYYDEVDESKKPKSSPSASRTSSPGDSSDDYYGSFDDADKKNEEEENEQPGLKQCMHLLGIGV